MKLPIAIIALSLAGCASHIRETYGPDGEPAYYANCRNKTNCAQIAGDTCKSRGFTILQDVERGGFSFSFGPYGGGGRSGANGMTFKCR